MKRLTTFTIIWLLTACSSFVRVPEITSTHSIPNKEKHEIYVLTLSWLAENAGNSKSFIMVQDPKSGRIVGSGNVFAKPYNNPVSTYDMVIDTKKAGVRIQYINIIDHSTSSLRKEKAINRARKHFTAQTAGLINYLKKNSTKDW